MQRDTVTRNYAETLLALATKAQNRDGFGTMIRAVANAIRSNPTVKLFLESPRVPADEKQRILRQALGDAAPRLFVRYLETLVQHRRQMLVPAISTEYDALLDEAEGRVHAEVTVARPIDEAETQRIAAQLARAVGKTVVPHVTVQPEIMGGVVVKIGDTVMDGSVKRRLTRLAHQMRAPV